MKLYPYLETSIVIKVVIDLKYHRVFELIGTSYFNLIVAKEKILPQLLSSN